MHCGKTASKYNKKIKLWYKCLGPIVLCYWVGTYYLQDVKKIGRLKHDVWTYVDLHTKITLPDNASGQF
jgi:hypothetical protein